MYTTQAPTVAIYCCNRVNKIFYFSSENKENTYYSLLDLVILYHTKLDIFNIIKKENYVLNINSKNKIKNLKLEFFLNVYFYLKEKEKNLNPNYFILLGYTIKNIKTKISFNS